MELPGRCGDWLDTATVTVQGSCSGSTRRARGGDFYLATSGDFLMATCGDFLMATDKMKVSLNPLATQCVPKERTARPVQARHSSWAPPSAAARSPRPPVDRGTASATPVDKDHNAFTARATAFGMPGTYEWTPRAYGCDPTDHAIQTGHHAQFTWTRSPSGSPAVDTLGLRALAVIRSCWAALGASRRAARGRGRRWQ